MRDHGGDLDRAIARYGSGGWLDLSTGINARSYPVPELEARAWTALPTNADITALETAAATYYKTPGNIVALAGAQAAIQLVPRLAAPGRACVVGPTYNEHAAALIAQGWDVQIIDDPAAGDGADALVVVNPNNPDGRVWAPDVLLGMRNKVGFLVVDESFADAEPKTSIAPQIGPDESRLLVLRSFGKFFGLAGLRMGFALSGAEVTKRLRALAGPWAISGPAIAIGRAALTDSDWQRATCAALSDDAARLDAMARQVGWSLVGGTNLFRTYDTANAARAQNALAKHHVWSRIFPYSDSWIRLGLPGAEDDWAQLERAVSSLKHD